MPVHYHESAKRHFQDGRTLLDSKRFANADHLVGLGVECAFKAVLVGMKAPTGSDGTLCRTYREHLPSLTALFREFVARQKGRNSLICPVEVNCFSNWSVEQRYCSDLDVTEAIANDHFKAAEKVMRMLACAAKWRIVA